MNKIQRNFKKEMKKGLKEVKNKDKESYYRYLMQNHLDNPEQRFTREKSEKVNGFFRKIFKGVLNIIIIMILIGGSVTYIKEKDSNSKMINTKNSNPPSVINNTVIDVNQKAIIKYLNAIKPYQEKINSDINLRNNDIKSVDKKLLTQKEYADNLIVYKNRINSNLIKIKNTTCPKKLNKYKDMLLQKNSITCSAIDYEIQYINTKDKAIFNKAVECFKKCNEMNKEISDEINGVLNREGIRHWGKN